MKLELVTILGIALLLTVALAFSPLGLGGGVLFMPIFHYLLGWAIDEAIIGSLMLVLCVATGSAASHSKEGQIERDIGRAGRITAVPGAVVGTFLASFLIAEVGDVAIKILAAGILAFVLERTITRSLRESNGGAIEVDVESKMNLYRVGTTGAGLASGLLGIGGGAILVTLHRSLLGMDARRAAGTSYYIGMVIVPVAFVTHLLVSGAGWLVIDRVGIIAPILMAVSVFCAAFFGARHAIRYIPKRIVTVVFIFAVSLSLLRYIIDFIGIL